MTFQPTEDSKRFNRPFNGWEQPAKLLLEPLSNPLWNAIQPSIQLPRFSHNYLIHRLHCVNLPIFGGFSIAFAKVCIVIKQTRYGRSPTYTRKRCYAFHRMLTIQKNNTHNHTTFRRTSNLPQKGNVDFLQLNSRPTTPRPQIRLPNNVRYIYSEWHQGRTRRAALIDRLGIGNLSGCRIAKTALAEDLLHCIYLFFRNICRSLSSKRLRTLSMRSAG